MVGKGYYSGQEVNDSDPAAVDIYDDIIPTTPTAKPTCIPDGGVSNPGSGYCPAQSGVSVLQVQGASGSPEDLDILWDITGASDTESSSVQFHVQNPFAATTRLFVKYHDPAGVAGASW